MLSLLLRKALPFTLTLVVGSALGWMFRPSPPASAMWTWPDNSTPALGREGPFGEPRGRGHKHCRMRRQYLVAETKPLVITFKPDARWPRGVDTGKGLQPVQVRVTFGADGRVQQVQPWDDLLCCKADASRMMVWEAVERAARQIQFTPETIDSVPVAVEREVEIRFITD